MYPALTRHHDHFCSDQENGKTDGRISICVLSSLNDAVRVWNSDSERKECVYVKRSVVQRQLLFHLEGKWDFHVDCGLETFARLFCSLRVSSYQSFAVTEHLKYVKTG
jgi:hypothetical protein